jgi:hypothetical protein
MVVMGTPEVATFEIAAEVIGCKSGHALKMRFRRAVYPDRFLCSLTPKITGVCLRELIDWIKQQRKRPEGTVAV